MMRISGWRVCGLGVALLVAISTSVANAETAEEVIELSIKAQGGRDALMAVKSVQRTGEVFVDGQFGQMEGTVEEVSIPWKKAYQIMDLGVFQQTSGYNGEIAWEKGMGGIEELEGERASQIKRGVALNPFMGMLNNDATAAKLDDETVDDVEYFVIEMTPADDGTPIKIYVAKETGFVSRVSFVTENPMFGEVEITAETSDYAEFGAIKLPTFTHIAVGDVLEVDTEFTETKVDEEVDESIFEMPEVKKADDSDEEEE